MNLQFQIDPELCIGCGECAEECPLQLLEMRDDIPNLSEENSQRCVRCQHCFAVCPTGALRIMGLHPANSLPLTGTSPVDPLQLSTLMKARRSIRRYSKEPVAPQDLAFLLETVGYAPTGVNNRQVLFTVIENPQVMQHVRERAYSALTTCLENDAFPEGLDHIKNYITLAQKTKRDTIFRNAPHMVIASSPRNSPCPEVDCHIALSHFELLATAMGLGTVWCGLAKVVLTMLTPEILTELGVPEAHRIGYMMMFGKPDVVYHRTVQRDGIDVNRVQELP